MNKNITFWTKAITNLWHCRLLQFTFYYCELNPMCPGVFLSDHAPGRGTQGPPAKILIEKSFWHEISHIYTLWYYKKRYKNIFKFADIGMIASLIMSIFWKIMLKMAKICFFSKINLVKAEKNICTIFF